MDKETLHFKIGLSGSTNTKQPEFSISVNNQLYQAGYLTDSENQIEYFEFDAELNEGDCELVIEFKNKTNADTVLDSNGNITQDLLLNVESVEIDDIDLGQILWTASKYRPNYPPVYKNMMRAQGKDLEQELTNCVNLGWNGKWVLPFTSPFYMWLLENI